MITGDRPPAVSAAMCASGRVLAEPRLSPDGTRVAVLVIDRGEARLVMIDAAGGHETVLTSDPSPSRCHPSGGGVSAWTPDGSALLFVSGDSLWRISATGGPAVPVVADLPGIWSPVPSPDGRHVAFIVQQSAVWVAPLPPIRAGMEAGPRPVAATTGFIIDPVWLDDDSLAWQAWGPPFMPWDRSRIEAVRLSVGGAPIVVASAPELQCQQPQFHPAVGLALVADPAGWLNVHRLAGGDLVPVVSEPYEHAGPNWGDRQRTFAISPDGRRIAFCRNEFGFGRLCVAELDTSVVHEVGKGVHLSLDWKGDHLVALRSGGVTPTQLVSYDTSGEPSLGWSRTVLARGPVAGFESALVEPELVSFAAADGTWLHARRYVPTGGGDGRAICWIHGGPTDQWPVEFNARMAFFLARGWTILVPDHRGSTGHGRAYAQAIRTRWGDLDVSDVVASLEHLRSQGWADQMVLMGGSAGGFTVLNVLARRPGLVKAAVALYPVTDLLAAAATTHRFESHYFESLIGPLPEREEDYRRRSVVASQISDPLLVLHGDSDVVVTIDQTRKLVAELAARGGDAELVEYAGEGHGWRQPATLVDELRRIEIFLDAHTSGGPR